MLDFERYRSRENVDNNIKFDVVVGAFGNISFSFNIFIRRARDSKRSSRRLTTETKESANEVESAGDHL